MSIKLLQAVLSLALSAIALTASADTACNSLMDIFMVSSKLVLTNFALLI